MVYLSIPDLVAEVRDHVVDQRRRQAHVRLVGLEGDSLRSLAVHLIRPAMQRIYGGVEQTLRGELARVTLEDVLREILAAPR